jgi:predicted DCC family thiol-disulfide oxidoreductase YuxK
VTSARQGLLVYDGECAFCTSAVAFMRRRINADVAAVAWQRADLAALGLTEQQCRDAVQYRDSTDRWRSGGRAVAALLRDSRPPWSWLGRLAGVPGLAWAVDRAYEVVARNRGRLPRLRGRAGSRTDAP